MTLVTGPLQIPRYLGGERTGSVFQGLTTPFRQDPPRGIGRTVFPDLDSEAPSAFVEGSSWGQCHETTAQTILASRRSRRHAISRFVGYIKAGQLRAIGVTTATHVEALPVVPPIAESVPGYEASGWHGIGAPNKTPTEIIEKLNKEINAIVADPKMQASFVGIGLTPLSTTPAEFGKFIADETTKWGKVVKFAGINPV